jgi:hypothetical protein
MEGRIEIYARNKKGTRKDKRNKGRILGKVMVVEETING